MMQLSIVSVPVTDQARARAFYHDVVGFSVEHEGDQGTPFAYVLMRPPAGMCRISLVQASDRMPAGAAQGLMLQTLDVDKMVERLAPRGLPLSEIKQASWGRFTTFADPDGNGWIIAEPSLTV